MYSTYIEQLLRDKGIETFDRVRITKLIEGEKKTYEGLLMPRPETGAPDCLVIKLDSGYNIGLWINNDDLAKGKIDISVRKTKVGRTTGKGKMVMKTTQKEKKPEDIKGMSRTKKISNGKNRIVILGCGGTISSKVEYMTGAVYPAMTEEELLSMFPEIEEIAQINAETVFSILSEDMIPLHWSMIAEKIKKHIDRGVMGIVITHGTDTMHYTSAALSFMLQNLPAPIILTGAQRSSDRGSTDARLNLLASVMAAGSDFGEVGICMHANINDNYAYVHRGTRVRKMHTSRRDAFKSINGLPLLRIDPWTRSVEELNAYRRVQRKKNEDPDTMKRETKLKFDNRINDNVAMVYIHPGLKPKLIEHLAKDSKDRKGYDGVVLIGTGLGHASTNPFKDELARPILDNVRSLIESGVPVVIAPQTIYGRLNLNVYTAGRKLLDAGVIGHLCDWTPETAYVKLCWVLGHERDMNMIKKEMETNMVGEISERSIVF